jgi:hypothetical protein
VGKSSLRRACCVNMNTTHHFVAGWIMQAVLIDPGGYEPPFPTAPGPRVARTFGRFAPQKLSSSAPGLREAAWAT